MHFRAFDLSPSDTLCEKVIKLSKENIRTLTGLLTGHCNLKKHQHRIGRVDSPLCGGCGIEEETPLHVMCDCVNRVTKRVNLLGKPFLVLRDLKELTFAKILGFFGEPSIL